MPVGFECAATIQLDCAPGGKQLVLDVATDSQMWQTDIWVFFGQWADDIGSQVNIGYIQTVFTPRNQFAIPDSGMMIFRFAGGETNYLLGSCIPKSMSEQCIQIAVRDSAGDGISRPGEYTFIYNGGDVAGSETTASFECETTVPFECRSYQFGNGCENVDVSSSKPAQCNNWTYPGEVVGVENILFNPYNDFFDQDSTLEPDRQTFFPTDRSTISGTPNIDGYLTQVPTFELLCAPDEIELTLLMTTDAYPDETSIITFFGQSMEDNGGLSTAYRATVSSRTGSFETLEADELMELRFDAGETAYVIGARVPTSIPCTQVLTADTFGDGIGFPGGYQISFGVSTVYDFETPVFDCRSYRFGEGCTNPTAIPEVCSYSDILELYPLNIVPLEIGDGSLGQFSPNPGTIAPTN